MALVTLVLDAEVVLVVDGVTPSTLEAKPGSVEVGMMFVGSFEVAVVDTAPPDEESVARRA